MEGVKKKKKKKRITRTQEKSKRERLTWDLKRVCKKGHEYQEERV